VSLARWLKWCDEELYPVVTAVLTLLGSICRFRPASRAKGAIGYDVQYEINRLHLASLIGEASDGGGVALARESRAAAISPAIANPNARARRSLKFCEMQVRLTASA
jgi:hypothetical protein